MADDKILVPMTPEEYDSFRAFKEGKLQPIDIIRTLERNKNFTSDTVKTFNANNLGMESGFSVKNYTSLDKKIFINAKVDIDWDENPFRTKIIH